MSAVRQIAVIGAGNLGRSLIRGMIECGFADAGAIRASCRTPEHAARITAELGVAATVCAADCVGDARWVIVALRPRDFASVAEDLARCMTTGQPVLSVMGAVSLDRLASSLGTDQVARAIPALSVARCKSVTPWTAARTLQPDRVAELRDLLAALGGELQLDDERLLDASASIGACAVAYHLELVDVLTSSGIRLGCAPDQARRLAEGSVVGAAALLDPDARARLRAVDAVDAVAHPGGATDCALQVLRARGVEQLFGAAIDAAVARLAEVSRQLAPASSSTDVD